MNKSLENKQLKKELNEAINIIAWMWNQYRFLEWHKYMPAWENAKKLLKKYWRLTQNQVTWHALITYENNNTI